MTDPVKLDLFLELSAFITGFERVELLGTGLALPYLEVVEKNIAPSLFVETLHKFDDARNDHPENIGQIMQRQFLAHPTYGPLLRTIIKLWYLGQWDALPESWQERFGNSTPVSGIISSSSYLEGLVWKAIDAHPMGGKQPGFGTWSSAPEEK